MTEIIELFEAHVRKLNNDVAAAEESLVVKAIILAGYDPTPEADAEWRKHVTLHPLSLGHKIIAIDGRPKWAIITEAPDVVIQIGMPPPKYEYTVRMEEVPYAWYAHGSS